MEVLLPALLGNTTDRPTSYIFITSAYRDAVSDAAEGEGVLGDHAAHHDPAGRVRLHIQAVRRDPEKIDMRYWKCNWQFNFPMNPHVRLLAG